MNWLFRLLLLFRLLRPRPGYLDFQLPFLNLTGFDCFIHSFRGGAGRATRSAPTRQGSSLSAPYIYVRGDRALYLIGISVWDLRKKRKVSRSAPRLLLNGDLFLTVFIGSLIAGKHWLSLALSIPIRIWLRVAGLVDLSLKPTPSIRSFHFFGDTD